MMNMSIRQEGLRRVVTAQVPPEENSFYEEKMLLSCRSGLLLPVLPGNEDGKRLYEYEVSGLIRITEFLDESGAGAETVRQLMGSFCRVSAELEEYLLNPDALVLDAEYLFWDPAERVLKFIYLPGSGNDFLRGLRDFTAMLLEQTDYEDREAVLLVYEFYRTVRAPEFRIEQLEKLQTREPDAEEPARDCEEDFVFTAESGDLQEEPEEVREKRMPVFRKEGTGRTWAVIAVCLSALALYETGTMESIFSGLSASGAKVFTICIMAAGCSAVISLQLKARKKDREGGFLSWLVAIKEKHGIISRKRS